MTNLEDYITRVSTLFFIFLVLSATSGCKPKNRLMKLQEVGFVEPKAWGLPLTTQQLKLSNFKLCYGISLRRCASSFVITSDGHLLTTRHGIVPLFERRTTGDDLDFGTSELNRLTKNMQIVSSFVEDSEGRPVEPRWFEFKAIAISNDDAVDVAVLQISNKKDLFSDLSFPVSMKLLGEKMPDDQRVFLAGFPMPHHTPDDLAKIEDFYSNSPSGSVYPSRATRSYSDTGFAVSTGIVNFGETDKITTMTQLDRDPDTNTGPKLNIDAEAATIVDGSSGGTIYDEEGYAIGIIQSGSGYYLTNKNPDNGEILTSGGRSLSFVNQKVDLQQLDLQFKAPVQLKEQINNKISFVQASLEERAEKLSTYLDSVFSLLKRKGKLKHSMTARKVKTGILSSSFRDRPACLTNTKLDRAIISIEKIEIEILSPETTKIRYKASERVAASNKFERFLGKAGWSPWFEIHTAHLLSETRMISIENIKVGNIELKSFGPMMYGKSKYSNKTFNIRGNFYTPMLALMQTIILGEIPRSSNEDDQGYWHVIKCANNPSNLVRERSDDWNYN